ncbi:hypothetical protein BDR03DRAFT_971635 [Suillus americanus]|nr:hypothetical protein BDR03DRAFT_971635 [Suillus americanus]
MQRLGCSQFQLSSACIPHNHMLPLSHPRCDSGSLVFLLQGLTHRCWMVSSLLPGILPFPESSTYRNSVSDLMDTGTFPVNATNILRPVIPL